MPCSAADQTVSSPPVFGIMFQNLSPAKRLQSLLKADPFFDHLRMGMKCDAVFSGRRLRANSVAYLLKLALANVVHRAARVSREVSERKAADIRMLPPKC